MGDYDFNGLRWVYIVVGIIYFLYGLAILITLGFDGNCFFRLNTFTDYRGGGSPDDLGLLLPDDDRSDEQTTDVISVSVLLGVAILWEGGYLFFVGTDWWNLWEDNEIQIKDAFNRHRWIRWGVSRSLFYVVGAYVAGLTNPWLIAAVGLIAFGTAFTSSTNEALNCRATRLAWERQDKSSFSMFDRNKYRLEAWLVGFVLWGFLLAVFIGYDVLSTDDVDNTATQAIPYVIAGVHGLLEFLILFFMTNGVATYWGEVTREVIFLIFNAVVILYVTIQFWANELVSSCPA